MKTVLVTGPIGSGKSAVCALLRERGLPVYDADARTKALYDRRPALVAAIGEALGTSVTTPEGRLDRARLAGLIFSDARTRARVEALVYPAVLQDFRRWRSRQKGAPLVVLESAVLLSKPQFDGLADAVVLVSAPEQLRIARVMERDGCTREQALARMAAQEDCPWHKAQVVLPNEGTPEALSAAVERCFFDKNSYLCKIIE